LTFKVRRPVAVSNRMMLNAVMFIAVGALVIWPQGGTPTSWVWQVIGIVFFLWAAFVIYTMRHPVLLRMTPDGVVGQSVFALHRFGWNALKWIDFTRPAAAAVLSCEKPNGTEGVILLTRKSTTDMDRADAFRIILEYRPGAPRANPQPFVTLKGTPA